MIAAPDRLQMKPAYSAEPDLHSLGFTEKLCLQCNHQGWCNHSLGQILPSVPVSKKSGSNFSRRVTFERCERVTSRLDPPTCLQFILRVSPTRDSLFTNTVEDTFHLCCRCSGQNCVSAKPYHDVRKVFGSCSRDQFSLLSLAETTFFCHVGHEWHVAR